MDLPLAIEERSDILSIEKFITDMLNIDPNMIESIESIQTSDNSHNILIKLKPSDHSMRPDCGQILASNDYKYTLGLVPLFTKRINYTIILFPGFLN